MHNFKFTWRAWQKKSAILKSNFQSAFLYIIPFVTQIYRTSHEYRLEKISLQRKRLKTQRKIVFQNQWNALRNLLFWFWTDYTIPDTLLAHNYQKSQWNWHYLPIMGISSTQNIFVTCGNINFPLEFHYWN